MPNIVYFSNVSENTKRFVEKLDLPAVRIPLQASDQIEVAEPYVLVTPTYGNGKDESGVPKQVIKFLNVKKNRDLIKGVLLYQFELIGTPHDVSAVKERMDLMWKQF